MCDTCDDQFDYIAKDFEDTLTDYRGDIAAHRVRDTPAKRVHDLAMMFNDLCKTEGGKLLTTWYLGLAVERLMALESAGIPT